MAAPSNLKGAAKLVVQVFKYVWLRYKALPTLAKFLVWAIVAFDLTVLGLLLYIGPSKVTQTFYDLAQELAHFRYGWLILGTVLVVLCFPPLMFYTTVISLCGFAYGLKGFLVAGPAAMIGSGLTFVLLRLLFKKRLKSWTSRNDNWQALEAVVRAKGLPLIILIRMSPFPPWVYSNACFASIEAVSLWQFLVATVFVLPKMLLVVFIGSRIAKFSDGAQRGQMDTTAKVLNAVSVVVSIALGILAGAVTYRLLQKQIKEMRESPDPVNERAAEALEEAEEGAPLLRGFS